MAIITSARIQDDTILAADIDETASYNWTGAASTHTSVIITASSTFAGQTNATSTFGGITNTTATLHGIIGASATITGVTNATSTFGGVTTAVSTLAGVTTSGSTFSGQFNPVTVQTGSTSVAASAVGATINFLGGSFTSVPHVISGFQQTPNSGSLVHNYHLISTSTAEFTVASSLTGTVQWIAVVGAA